MRVFVNTLERLADRRVRMKQILDSYIIPYEFFNGPDGRKLERAEIEEAYDEGKTRKNLGRVMSPSEIGCTMGHRAIYKKMMDENIEKACILEDDVVLDDDFPQILAFLDDFNFKNTVVKLDNYLERNTFCSMWVNERISDRVMLRKPVTTQWMTWGYVMDRRAAMSILQAWPKIEFVCDDWKRMGAAVELRCVQPAVVHQNVTLESAIDEDRKELLGKTKQAERGANWVTRIIHIIKIVFLIVFS